MTAAKRGIWRHTPIAIFTERLEEVKPFVCGGASIPLETVTTN